uniref:Uncharacterized protein n=1 Tax=Anguilla anguilla TaxID=7936 RepID=A0A0E9X725_ANGAN
MLMLICPKLKLMSKAQSLILKDRNLTLKDLMARSRDQNSKCHPCLDQKSQCLMWISILKDLN